MDDSKDNKNWAGRREGEGGRKEEGMGKGKEKRKGQEKKQKLNTRGFHALYLKGLGEEPSPQVLLKHQQAGSLLDLRGKPDYRRQPLLQTRHTSVCLEGNVFSPDRSNWLGKYYRL